MTSRRTRQRLIDRLRREGIRDERVLTALANTPRHIFVDEALASRAYEDIALPIGHNQTISQPYVVAAMTEILLAGNAALQNVLEIGTGSGYQTAILAQLVGHVHTVERIGVLLRQARDRLYHMRLRNITYHTADGAGGLEQHAPYDGILVAAAPTMIPDELYSQLTVGGRLVIPVGENSKQRLVLVEREAAEFVETEFDWVNFVPLIAGKV
jgi:protein-L-isoaspartate(D-aspartate) O-methyltransferase